MHIQKKLKDKVSEFMDLSQPNMGDALGIEFLSFKTDEVKASMPVNENTIQPFGILHGGASVALAETLASIGAWLNAPDDKSAVGVEINANHLRSVSKGNVVTGVAVPIHRGRQIQIWETKIYTSDEKLVCISRCTLAMVNRS